jgi:hypothetical protein
MCETGRLDVAEYYRNERSHALNVVVMALLLCLAGLTTACGSVSSSQGSGVPSSSNTSPGLSLSPGTATVTSQQRLQFTARVSGTSETAVTWSASAGSISSDGFFTAPRVNANTAVIVTATKYIPIVVNNRTFNYQAYATVTVAPLKNLSMATTALPIVDASTPYSAALAATGGVEPYQWTLMSGALPTGFKLSSSGAITGTTASAGSFTFTVKVTDSSGSTSSASFHLTVAAGSASGFDGPAELPRVYIQSTMADTSAPGSTITVNAGGNLQSALNSANCGDTIQLQAGSTFTGPFTFPAKSCDDNHWIIVRTNADDSLLPAEGSRMTPCYAGVSSLPGRPDFHCASTTNVLAKLVMASYGNAANGPILFASGANHYRLLGLEVTRATGIGIIYALASVASGGTANNLILDRIWMHGTAQDETNRGVWLEGVTYLSLVDSFLTDFHCSTVCGDAQAVAGGLGSGPMGPYKISGNFLEASTENVMFGGGAATATPADIEISHNHMFKPLTWMKGQPGYVGGPNGPFTVKNLIELKNAQRVLIDGNILENTWGGFSQVGFAILLTPKNQSSGSSNVCPDCLVTDVTIRNSTISHVAAGLQIANVLAGNGSARDGERYSIHDLLVDDIDGIKFNGPGEFAQISVNAGAPLLQNVWISHVTAFPKNTMLIVGNDIPAGTPMRNIVFANNIVNASIYPMWSTGSGGKANCAVSDIPLTTFNACFTASVFSGNAIIAASADYPASKWPASNFFPSSPTSIEFVNYNGGNGGDYHLQSSSPYKGKGTDGKDLGADIDAVNSAIAGVE